MQNKTGFWASDLRPNKIPKRIVSVVPSQTELLYDLGLQEEVVAITLFCVHPKKWHTTKLRIGGTKKLRIQSIKDISPDFILANKEENTKADIEHLAKTIPVYVTDVSDLQSAYTMMEKVGEVVGKKQKAQTIATRCKQEFSKLKKLPKKSVCYLIWKEPFMSVGSDTFIHYMLHKAGYSNVFNEYKRYPEISLLQIKQKQPDIIFLSTEPFPFKEKHCREMRELFPTTQIQLVDGEYFSWYGSRLLSAADYFLSLVNSVQ